MIGVPVLLSRALTTTEKQQQMMAACSCVPDEDVFWSLKIEILHDMREELVKNLMPYKFFSYLRSKRVFDADDCDMIEAERLNRKKVEKFLDILEIKGPNAFNEFCNYLRENKTQVWILKKILDSFEKKKRDKIAVQAPQEVINEDKDKGVTVVMTTPTSTPSLVIPPLTPSGSFLPGPPTPPDECPSSSTFVTPTRSTTTTLTGNSVSQVTSPEENFPGSSLPSYSSGPPRSPPPPYRE